MEIANALGINPIVMLIQICIFLVFYLILKKFLFLPILKIVEAREAVIQNKNKQIEELKKKVEELEAKINTLLADADKEILAVEENKLKEILHTKAKVIEELNAEFAKTIESIRKNTEDEKQKAIEALEAVLHPIKKELLTKIFKNSN